MDGGWCPTFWFFKSIDNYMVYSLGIGIYIHVNNESMQNKVLWDLKFGEVGGWCNNSKII